MGCSLHTLILADPLSEEEQLPRDGGEGAEAKAEERRTGGHCQAPGGEGPEAAGNQHEGGEDRLLGVGVGDLGRGEPRLGHKEWLGSRRLTTQESRSSPRGCRGRTNAALEEVEGIWSYQREEGGWGRSRADGEQNSGLTQHRSWLQPPTELIWGVELEWGQGEDPS